MADVTVTIPIERVAPDLNADIRAGLPVSVFGMSFGERAHVAASIDGFAVFLTTDYVAARAACIELNQLGRGEWVHLPARADVLSYVSARDFSIPAERASALGKIATGRARGVVTTADALLQLYAPPARWLASVVNVAKGEEVSPASLGSRLTAAGYSRRDLVEGVGQWSLRGDILDVFPMGETRAVRIEFWGDLVEKIRYVDPDTQLSDGEAEDVTVYPACETVFDASEGEIAARAFAADRPKKLEPDYAARFDRIESEITARLNGGANDASLEFAFPYLPHATFADWLPADATIVYDETKALFDNFRQAEKEHAARYKNLLATGEATVGSLRQMTTFEDYLAAFGGFRSLSFARITSSNFFFDPRKIYNYNCAPITRYSLNFAELAEDVRRWTQSGYKVLLCGRDAEGTRAVRDGLARQGLAVGELDDVGDFLYARAGVGIVSAELEKGYSYHERKVIVVGSGDIFPARTKRIRKTDTRQAFVQPVAGDYVVHYVHGIGKCLGTTRLTTSLGTKDYIEIEYRDGDKLYVPVDQMDLLSKFSGESPRLSKMGGKEFAKVKERVKASVKAMAVDLVKLYGARLHAQGYRYSIDESMTDEFVAKFPFRSTPDQLAATAEIYADLASGKIMDRLLVGDVGYGKTEVALRAAFAVMLEGKQVAFLAPTTILSEQHYRTAEKRFAEYGIRMGVLNRFVSAAKQRETLKKLEKGELDFVCGTHRLLSKDVRFRDLGLLVLDEEQRFGVADKEKLKVLKNTVNVLTMTATPIPRTLHMSMSGIRDISTLANPPADRLPVQTTVTEYTDSLARDCITREIARGGQAFVVCNRVESIYRYAAHLAEQLPNARIIVCHGQMSEAELETNVKKFYDGDADVLVSTTIVENGIDLPSANTMLVVDADRLGLSQLYQLRGRVGRSNRLAYAYFTYTAGKLLSEVATKRLSTLLEFTEFGSGFKIAMRDLEIRGAGNVLGREQHGHMEKVGYDLYCRMLGEAVAEIRGETRAEERECEVVMDVDAYLPDDYIRDAESRMNVYARVAAVRSRSDRERLKSELKDVYGELPRSVLNLVTVGLYKGYGVRLGIEQIKVSKQSAAITLSELTPWAATLLAARDAGCVLKPAAKPVLIFTPDRQSMYERVFLFLERALVVKKTCENPPRGGETLADA